METVTNITNAATQLIWGDTTKKDENQDENETLGQEPASGEVGDTAHGEPYDKGNAEPSTASTTDTSTTNTTVPESSTIPSITTGSTPATGPIRPEHDTDKTGVTSIHNPTSATSSDKPTSSNDTSGPGVTPSVGAVPESGAAPTTKQQGADRPGEIPGSDESERIKETKREAEEAANVKTDGPGPVPLEQKAKAGRISAGGEDDGPQKESHGEGTGEKYVKSSGLKADGGDFDAANPGAGKEADRLLEEKGIRHETPATAPTTSTPTSSSETSKISTPDTKETKKPSLKEKIKEKLHRH